MKKIFISAFIPIIITCCFWLIKLSEVVFQIDLHELGIYPRTFHGLIGIITSPFIHENFAHLMANTMPFMVLGTTLFHFYRGISSRIFLLIWFFSGIATWLTGRPSWHIGASGIDYGLFSFLLFSGLIRKNRELIAISLLTVFLYGGMIWGFVPKFSPENVSYEAHGGGLLVGIILTAIYRKKGPQQKHYQWQDEDDEASPEKHELKIVIDKAIPYIKSVLEPYAKVVYIEGSQITPSDVYDADALIVRTRTKCNKKLLENSTVRYIASTTIGFDHIDVEYCQQNNIAWSNAAGCNSTSVMQYMASALAYLSIQKNIDLKSKTIGIIGVGHVGKKIVKLAEIFGMKALLYDPPRALIEGNEQFTTLEEVQKNADIVTFHVPLQIDTVNATFHLADEFFFNDLKRKPFIINTSRGEVVNTQALKNALKNDVISGCILDVFENEPDIDKELLEKCFLATPHIAGYSADGKSNGTTQSVQAISRFFHLPLDHWQVTSILEAENCLINPSQYDEVMILFYCILKSYNILLDNTLLRNNPTHFESIRNHYPVRREYPAFTVCSNKIPPYIKEKLLALGFKIEENKS